MENSAYMKSTRWPVTIIVYPRTTYTICLLKLWLQNDMYYCKYGNYKVCLVPILVTVLHDFSDTPFP